MEMPRQTKTGQEEKAVARGWEGALDSTWADTEEISLLPSCAYNPPASSLSSLPIGCWAHGGSAALSTSHAPG